MRIIFCGTPTFAVPTLGALVESPHEAVLVVTQPDRPAGRGGKLHVPEVKCFAVQRSLPVFQPEDINAPESLALLRSVEAEAMVVVAFGQKLSPEVLDLTPRGAFNVHGSLLPRYRGAAPMAWALIKGERETGITLIRMGEAIDAGDMLAKATLAIEDDWTEADLDRELAPIGAKLMVDTLDRLERGEVDETPQDPAQVTFARRLKKSDGRIRWRHPARRIHNRIRGVTPWPGAFTFIQGARRAQPVRLVVLKASLAEGTKGQGDKGEEAPGTVISVDDGTMTVATGDGAIRLEEVKPAGSHAMAAGAFARGYGIAAGAAFQEAGD